MSSLSGEVSTTTDVFHGLLSPSVASRLQVQCERKPSKSLHEHTITLSLIHAQLLNVFTNHVITLIPVHKSFHLEHNIAIEHHHSPTSFSSLTSQSNRQVFYPPCVCTLEFSTQTTAPTFNASITRHCYWFYSSTCPVLPSVSL